MRLLPWLLRCSVSWGIVITARNYVPDLLQETPAEFIQAIQIISYLYISIQFCVGFHAALNVLVRGIHGKAVELLVKPSSLPRLRIIVCTWGTNPDLVNNVMKHNVKQLVDLGFSNILFEVYANKHFVKLENIPNIDQNSVLVPETYEAPHRMVAKARTLSYIQSILMNEESPEKMSSQYLLLMDQDVRLTPSSAAGVLNFMADGTKDFANGFSYVFLNRDADSMRVALMNDFTDSIGINCLEFMTVVYKCKYPLFANGGFQMAKVTQCNTQLQITMSSIPYSHLLPQV